MRSATFALLAALALGAYAQDEGELVRPKVRLPGGRDYRPFASKDFNLEGLGLDEVKAIEDRIKTLNEERARLKEQLAEANKKVLEAQKEANGILAQLDQQDAAFIEYLGGLLPGNRGNELAVRLRLMPVIHWLELSPDKAGQLITKQLALIEIVDVRRQVAVQARAAAAGDAPQTAEERKAKIELLKKYADLTRQWIANIREAVQDDPDKLAKFNERFRRTRHLLEGGM